MRHSLTHLQVQTHIRSPPYRHTPKSIHPGLNPNPRPQMDRRLGETVQFFFGVYEQKPNNTQWNVKKREISTTCDEREREEEEKVATGMMGTWRMGLWEMARGKARERKKERKKTRGFCTWFASHNGWCGLRRLPDEAQDRESVTFQTQ